MDAKRRFSLAYLFLIVFWFALAFGLWRVVPIWPNYRMPNLLPVDQLLYVCMLASAGAGVGGFFKNMKLGGAIGAVLMICCFVLFWGLQQFFEWLFPL